MKAVIVDGYTLNPGDLSWDGFKALCECVIYDFTRSEELYDRVKDADIIITNKVILSGEMISRLPQLKYIGVLATGYNIVDVEAAHAKGIMVTNILAYSTQSVAELAFAHLLNIVSQVEYHNQEVHKGRWESSRDFSFWDKPFIELDGKTMGIIGLGHIGSTVAKIALAFSMKVVSSTSKSQDELSVGIEKVTQEELFRMSDVISLHCPLTPETEKLVNEEKLSWMKPSAILINTARGGLVDEQALADALNNDRLYAAGLDVLSQEPPTSDNPLLKAKNCYITPHYAWATLAARQRLMSTAVANLKGYLEGKPQNTV
jgi:Lactate dehydrogenase and related dehydrogenases